MVYLSPYFLEEIAYLNFTFHHGIGRRLYDIMNACIERLFDISPNIEALEIILYLGIPCVRNRILNERPVALINIPHDKRMNRIELHAMKV